MNSARSRIHLKLGDLFEERFQKSGGSNNLQGAIYNKQKAVKLIPEDHPDRVRLLQGLGLHLRARFHRSANPEDLETAIQRCQEALDQTPVGHSDRAKALFDLGACLGDRYELLGDLQDFQAATEKVQAALDLSGTDHPHRVSFLVGLAWCFQKRFLKLGDLQDLETAIQKYQDVLAQISAKHPDRAQILFSLATSFGDRYQRLGDLNDLESATEKGQAALDLMPPNHPRRVQVLRGVAWCLQRRYRRLGAPEDLTLAMQAYSEVWKLIPPYHVNRAQVVLDLAVCFVDRYERLGELKDLETAIRKSQKALSLTTADHPLRVAVLQRIGLCYRRRFDRLGTLEDLQAAIEIHQEVLDRIPADSPVRAEVVFVLATSFGDRYRRLGDLKDLEVATKKAQIAFNLMPEDHTLRVQILQGLAWCFQTRYQRLGNQMDLETATQKYQQVLDGTPSDDPRRPSVLFSLASSFGDRYRRIGDLKDLNAAMQNSEMALELIPADHPSRRAILESHASYFQKRYERLGDLRDLETAIQKHKQTVDLTPADLQAHVLQGLAKSLRDRYRRLGNLKDLTAAIKEFEQALEMLPQAHPYRPEGLQGLASCFGDKYQWSRKQKDLELASNYYIASFQTSILTQPESSWDAALEWASFANRYTPSYGPVAYSAAFQLLPEILWIGHDISVRHDTIRRLNIGPVTSIATRTCIQLANLPYGVQMIEQGIATVFQQILQLKPAVDTLPPHQAQELRQLSSQLYSGTAEGDVAIERYDLLAKIRKEKGHKYFLRPKPYSVLCHAAQKGPVVILNSHEDGCDGIVILNPLSKPVHVPLPHVTLALLKSQQAILRELLGRCNVRSRADSVSTRLFGNQEKFSSKPVKECFSDMLSWLWTNVVDPVYQLLASNNIHHGRLWWLPSGGFAGLPLHASDPTDKFIHSYTATLGSLLEAYRKKPSNSVDKLAVVGVTHTDPGGGNYLKGVKQEVQNIKSVLGNPNLNCLEGHNATPDAVKLQLQNSSWVHLACHGTQDLVQPTKSCLLLYEGSLELETILRMPLPKAEFVFLAACQTAMGDAELVNESFHLGGGFIAAGFRSAVGTLWSMNDQDGPVVAEIFYSHLFHNGRKPHTSDTAEALHIAVKELKARDVPYERWVPFIHMGV
ncbi:CHAT domain-containing protein [Mycena galericulata]|nr:CHAT domain-containing protein [Mycena galericulata]